MQSIPDRVTYHCYDSLMGLNGTQAIPVVVAPRRLTHKEVTKQFHSKWQLWRRMPEADIPTRAYKNVPIEDAKVTSLDQGSSMFRVSFAVHGIPYQAQLAGATLLDIIQSVGITKDGLIPAGLVWTSMQKKTYMRLMRVGSDRYELYKKKDEKRSRKVIPKSKLIPGHLYENLVGIQAIYIGKVHTIDFIYRWSEAYRTIICWRVLRNVILWYEEWYSDVRDRKESIVQRFKTSRELKYFKLKQRHAHRLDLGKVVDLNFEAIRDDLMVNAFELVKKALKGINITELYEQGKYLNMVPVTEVPGVSSYAKDLVEASGAVIILPGTRLEELPEFLTHENLYVRREAQRYYREFERGGL